MIEEEEADVGEGVETESSRSGEKGSKAGSARLELCKLALDPAAWAAATAAAAAAICAGTLLVLGSKQATIEAMHFRSFAVIVDTSSSFKSIR